LSLKHIEFKTKLSVCLQNDHMKLASLISEAVSAADSDTFMFTPSIIDAVTVGSTQAVKHFA